MCQLRLLVNIIVAWIMVADYLFCSGGSTTLMYHIQDLEWMDWWWVYKAHNFESCVRLHKVTLRFVLYAAFKGAILCLFS